MAGTEIETPYMAPLQSQPNHLIIPGRYIVTLASGHNLADHSAVIGRDLALFGGRQFKLLEPQVVYSVHNVDDELLKAIRSDPKCVRVDYDLKGQQF
ncbi:hypothetical protein SLS62_002012 [Diatrype stigma]|uniref:Uncharacterized protein n=1 Tax=Diatrype stigma TaxID=117547 RepID=A0AAN9UV11_9PEZI